MDMFDRLIECVGLILGLSIRGQNKAQKSQKWWYVKVLAFAQDTPHVVGSKMSL